MAEQEYGNLPPQTCRSRAACINVGWSIRDGCENRRRVWSRKDALRKLTQKQMLAFAARRVSHSGWVRRTPSLKGTTSIENQAKESGRAQCRDDCAS